MGKTLFFVLLIVGGAVVPYLMNDDQWLRRLESTLKKPSDLVEAPSGDAVPAETAGGVPLVNVSATKAQKPIVHASKPPVGVEKFGRPMNVGAGLPLPLVLSFKATPSWIRQNWDRVTTKVGELDLQGWRVPYAKGVQEDDFAGSVTYYFDRSRLVQRIILHGYTAEASEFVNLALQHYSMRRVPNPDVDLYIATESNRAIGALYVKYAPLLGREKTNQQCEVFLELNRRETEYGMSYETDRFIASISDMNTLLTPIPAQSFNIEND